MTIRIVKMTFEPEKIDEFIALFDRYKEKIRAVEGCTHLELLQSEDQKSIFMTYSHWKDPKFLEAYRHSELFKEIWPATKALFADRPEAWSVNQRVILD